MTRKRNRLRPLVVAALAAALVVAVGLEGARAVKRALRPEPPEIAVIIKTTAGDIEFWRVFEDGVRVAAKEFDVVATVDGPPNESAVGAQIASVYEAIEREPDAIVLAATDYNRLVPAAEAIRDRGIELVTVDSGINSDAAASFIATDNLGAGRKAGEAMAELLPRGAKVAIVSFVEGTATQIDREHGVRERLDAAGIDVVGTFHSDGDADKAYRLTKELIERETQLRGVVGLNETSTVGAGKAIRDAGKGGDIKLVGFDSSIDEVKLLEEGVIQATVVQQPFQMGYLGVKTAVDAIRGKRVPEAIATDSVLITKETMYTDENQKLLFPFVER